MTEISLPKELSLRKPSLLDCFCGMGGVSDGFALEGFDVTGIDIVDAPKMLGYKHKFIQADMLTLNGEDFKAYDVIWGSPPCRDFVTGSDAWWKTKKIPDKGLVLINIYLTFIEQAKPTFWIMENVRNAAKYVKQKPIGVFRISQTMYRCFWGNFPMFLVPIDGNKPLMKKIDREGWSTSEQGKIRQWKKAKIPLACSRAFARACREGSVKSSVMVYPCKLSVDDRVDGLNAQLEKIEEALKKVKVA